MKPKVSVIMPVLNGERFIGEAIQSIVHQTYLNIELVIVDDGSTDSTCDVIEGYRNRIEIRYVRHDKPLGIPNSMNDGVRHSSGDLIAFLDHDDVWLPNFVETQVEWLETHPGTGMVHSDFQTIDVAGGIIEASVAAVRGRKRPSGRVFEQLFMDSFIVGNSVMIRRECFDRLGLFDESLRWGDYHMWMRIARHYPVDYVDQVLTKYRQHPAQSTRSSSVVIQPDAPPVALKAIEKILAAYPEIRRELGSRKIKHRIASFYFDLAYSWYSKGEFSHARVCMRRALKLWPGNVRYWVLFAGALMPKVARAGRRSFERVRGRPAAEAGIRGIAS
jgi:glycosyltransferase involved in cell wall biosynthesis